MKADNKNTHRDRSREPESNLNRDIHKHSQEERFPEANMAKESREAASEAQLDDSTTQELADDVAEAKATRPTSRSVDDIAGVSDLDKGMRRAEEK
jgi:hypothetical protein